MKIFIAIDVVVVLIVSFGLYRTFTTPSDLYAETGRLAACPSRPSCVSSLATDEVHAIAPLQYVGDPVVAQGRLKSVLRNMGITAMAHEADGYLHAVFETPTMKFRDDLELLIKAEGRIEVRSVSRFGYRDFGVNRARVEELRKQFETQ